MKEFDLEKTIATWRHALQLDRAFLKEDLDELESHLRDHIDALVEQQVHLHEAFEKATKRLGNYGELTAEYKKVRYGRSKRKRNLLKESIWQCAMLKNYFKTALRNFRRHKGFAAINLSGLAVALAGCLLISHYVQDEVSYDRFHEKSDRIYRLGGTTVGWPYGRFIESEYPEVEKVVYLRSWPTFSIKHEDQYFFENMLYADDGFFDVFDFSLSEGNPETALTNPYTLVLSESMALKFFGEERALNRTLTLADTLQFTVTGVVQVPKNSHIQFDLLMSFETLRSLNKEWFEHISANGWLDVNVVNYVLLREDADAEEFASKISNVPQERAGEYLSQWGMSDFKLNIEPLHSLYLRSANDNMIGPESSINHIYLLGTVGLFLILIAIVNFVNLATARSMERAREVGVRKVVGSNRGALIRQFLFESFLTTTLAVVLSFGLAWLALPFFNELAIKHYSIRDLLTFRVVLTLIGMSLLVGFLAGFYPALSLSSHIPIEVLKGRFAVSRRGGSLRRGLVVFQFAISGILILGTLTVLSQLNYMQQQDLGFYKEQVIVLDTRQVPYAMRVQQTEALKQTLSTHPAVDKITASWTTPGRTGWLGQLSFPEGWPEGESIGLEYIGVDHDFVDVFDLSMVAGRNFSPDFSNDAVNGVIINEAAVEAVGWASAAEAIGKRFTSPGSGKPEGVVIGVVEDYHHHGLQQQIQPIMYGIMQGTGLFSMRLSSADTGSFLDHLEKAWATHFDGYPFDFFFLDQDYARQYAQEERLMGILSTFATLTILIACLGLFGLTAFTATQRTKEIGVRKLLGASVLHIVLLLGKDFLKWILIAFLLAAPIAYFAMSKWLEDFAYRTPIGIHTFLIGGAFLLVFALITVSFQVIKVSWSQPVQSLRYE